MSDQSLLEFPCDFPVKIMGRESAAFRSLAREMVERHVGPVNDNCVQSSLSRNGSFVSVTITVHAQNQLQLDNIYREVSAHVDVLMAL